MSDDETRDDGSNCKRNGGANLLADDFEEWLSSRRDVLLKSRTSSEQKSDTRRMLGLLWHYMSLEACKAMLDKGKLLLTALPCADPSASTSSTNPFRHAEERPRIKPKEAEACMYLIDVFILLAL
jgi:hypothetical protein